MTVPAKPIPGTDTIPATQEDKQRNANISPQGHVKPTGAPSGSKYTPEGDQEGTPGIPPSANDPVNGVSPK